MIHYYEELERNFGVIENINVEEYFVYVSNDVGILDIACCQDFVPTLGMRVELFIDEEKGWVLCRSK